jgi:hypothetical protein
VERGKKIKGKIRKKYEETFTVQKLEEEAKFTREILAAAGPAAISNRRGGVNIRTASYVAK